MEEEKKKNKYFNPKSVLTYTQIRANKYDPITFNAGGLLVDKKMSTIYAQGGTGKSFIAMQVAHAVSTGGKLFGEIECTQQKVLYVDLEDDARTINQRANLDMKLVDSDNFYYVSAEDEPIDIMDDYYRGSLVDYCALEEIDVLIVDSIQQALRGDVSSNADATLFYNNMKEFLREGLTILFVHHTNKAGMNKNTDITDQNKMLGSSQHTDNVRSTYLLQKDPESEQLFLTTVKDNVGSNVKITLDIVTKDGVLSYKSVQNTLKTYDDVVMETLARHGEQTRDQLSINMLGYMKAKKIKISGGKKVTPENVAKVCRSKMESGLVTQNVRNRGKKCYSIT